MQVGKKIGVRRSAFGAANAQSEIRNPQSNGFTLVEIVITIVLIGVLSGIAAMIILQGVRSYSGEQTRSDAHYQARIAMERMAREIRLIRSQGADIITMANNDLRFIDVTGATIGFSWAGPVLSRWNGASNDLLASGITAFTFNYYQQDGVTAASPADLWFVEITMTASAGGETFDMRTRVHPRNF
ncbi:MAG: type II secretion system GspH family protein [Nitrospirota bacterium]|nr:type II secretion system GspH family protein [Nitrospirota bacterium]